ncbi:MAG TPA: cupin domain-containing protein [Thermoanaerobaculia bacterium]|nr:cupin domain-containing protein [Thermoanaerobaculia bacterium]
MRSSRRAVVLSLVAFTGIVAAAVVLEARPARSAPSVQRTVLTRQDTAVPGREAIMAVVEIPPGGTEGRHVHPNAEVYAFVLEGTLALSIEGKPTATLEAGDVYTVAPGQIHESFNVGAAPVKVNVVFFAEKGKPLTTPIP